MTSREQLLASTFVSLADTLVADVDVIDFLHTLATRSVELLDADAAGIMLADQHGGLHVMAPPPKKPACSNSTNYRTTKAPAWTATDPAATWPATTRPR